MDYILRAKKKSSIVWRDSNELNFFLNIIVKIIVQCFVRTYRTTLVSVVELISLHFQLESTIRHPFHEPSSLAKFGIFFNFHFYTFFSCTNRYLHFVKISESNFARLRNNDVIIKRPLAINWIFLYHEPSSLL